MTTTTTTRVASSSTRNRILKDSNGDVNEHLHNHIHLTNCIHLKNHMHKQSPILTDRVLMKDLIVLQRSRSLRDPSASPPPWISPYSAVDLHPKKGDFVERSHRLSDSSPKVTLSDERLSLVKDLSCESDRKVKRDESSRKSYRVDQSMNSEISKDREKKSSLKTLSDQLNEVVCESDDLVSSNLRSRVRNGGNVGDQGGIGRPKRRKFRGTRRIRGKNELSIAPNSLENCLKEQNMNKACGIPLNWSRIHDRGRTFFDKAGRSLSCGISDSRGKKDESNSDMLFPSDVSSSLIHSETEAFPLLVETGENEDWEHDYSGELGVFADDLLNNQESNLKKRLGIARHKSFTQKYEPKTFRDLVGQSLVVQALSNAVSRSRLGVLYVFYGRNGTGKSSCARIFARALNCESIDQFKPCGICSSCVGKSLNIKEVSSVANLDMMDLQETRHYKVLIFDDYDTLSSDCWNLLSKLVNRAPRGVILILVCSRLEVLPHMIISRCQKFFFPKLKDADIVKSLKLIASKEEIEIEKDALKLIASRSDGSLRDAVMTLEQLSLLGQRISVPLVQELVGLVSDEKLVDLLDLALSADTVNTVKNLRTIMETSVEPLALMSQLATVITDILAGSYDFSKDHRKRKFFRRKPLSKEDMEKLRQALKTLSEAEKQLRVSNDKSTWLTAALLQLAPDQHYLLPHSSMETSLNLSSDAAGRSFGLDRRKDSRQDRKTRPAVEEIWLEVIEKLRANGLRELLYKEGRIVSLSLGSAPTVQLMFSSELTKSMAEKFCSHIMQAFESVLESPVTIEIRCEAKRDSRNRNQHYPPAKDGNFQSSLAAIDDFKSGRSEIVEVSEACGQQWRQQEQDQHLSARRKHLEASQDQKQSIVRGKVSLGHVIQQTEGCRLQKNLPRRRAVSIAEKLEQENLRLEARSRSLLCWKSTKGTRRKVTRLKMKTRRGRQNSLLKLISCGKCLSRSPR